MRKKSKKLDYIKLKLFFIKAKKRTISYKFNLVKNTKLYLILYILLLKIADTKISIQYIFYYQV